MQHASSVSGFCSSASFVKPVCIVHVAVDHKLSLHYIPLYEHALIYPPILLLMGGVPSGLGVYPVVL